MLESLTTLGEQKAVAGGMAFYPTPEYDIRLARRLLFRMFLFAMKEVQTMLE
jgi:hypothetical protein